VAPGFEYEDMEIAGRAELLARYPQHREIIEKLTRA
jgi:predicted cupin superfamily sugar epimerase